MERGEILRKEREKNLKELRNKGIYPFKETKYERTHTVNEFLKSFSGLEKDEKKRNKKIRLAGRIITIRDIGEITFMDLKDHSTHKETQIFFESDTLGEKYEIVDLLNRGDFIGIKGFPFRTKKGELSAWVEEFKVLSKALRPLPSEWYGLKDVEQRYKQRYLDLIMNKETREIFMTKTKVMKYMRKYLRKQGYIEVDTPILQSIYGGALAEPFETFCNDLDQKMYLRISDELYLKRLIVGQLGKVFEIGKDFRNESIDSKHNPEFLLMESYEAYADYKDIMELVENMISYIVKKIKGTTKVKYQGETLDFEPPWERMSMVEAIEKYSDVDSEKLKTRKTAKQTAEKAGIEVDKTMNRGDIVEALFEEFAEPNLIQPTFVMHHPVEISPLAKRRPDNKRQVERFEPFVMGMEIGNAYSEQNDPEVQLEAFEQQKKMREEREDKEAHPVDMDYVKALEYGMPPTGGLGLPIERITMLLTNQTSIKEVILFPMVK